MPLLQRHSLVPCRVPASSWHCATPLRPPPHPTCPAWGAHCPPGARRCCCWTLSPSTIGCRTRTSSALKRMSQMLWTSTWTPWVSPSCKCTPHTPDKLDCAAAGLCMQARSILSCCPSALLYAQSVSEASLIQGSLIMPDPLQRSNFLAFSAGICIVSLQVTCQG